MLLKIIQVLLHDYIFEWVKKHTLKLTVSFIYKFYLPYGVDNIDYPIQTNSDSLTVNSGTPDYTEVNNAFETPTPFWDVIALYYQQL